MCCLISSLNELGIFILILKMKKLKLKSFRNLPKVMYLYGRGHSDLCDSRPKCSNILGWDTLCPSVLARVCYHLGKPVARSR